MKIQKEIAITKGITTKEAVMQNLKDKCAFCGKGKAEISITDSETLKEIFICDNCDKSLNWNRELTAKEEDFVIESGLEQIRESRKP